MRPRRGVFRWVDHRRRPNGRSVSQARLDPEHGAHRLGLGHGFGAAVDRRRHRGLVLGAVLFDQALGIHPQFACARPEVPAQEDARGYGVEFLPLDRLQHTGRDARACREVLEREAAVLPTLAKPFSHTHGFLRFLGRHPCRIRGPSGPADTNDDGRRLEAVPARRSTKGLWLTGGQSLLYIRSGRKG